MASTLILIASGVAAAADIGAEVLPPAAATAIRAVSVAADSRDFAALRPLIGADFVWSFGGDRNLDQALAEWAKDPRYLRALSRVLRSGCQSTAADHVECPGGRGDGFRSGFLKTADRWRMEYFVEGD